MVQKQNIGVRLPHIVREEILEAVVAEKKTKSTAMHELLADGLKFRMLEAGVSREFLQGFSTEGVFDLYSQFKDATASQVGVVGPMGNRYRFEQIDDGNMVLRSDEILVDGEIFQRKQQV